MEGFDNSDLGCDKGSQLDTPFYTPYQKPMLPKSGLDPVNMDLSLSSPCDSSVASMKEGSGSPSPLSSDSEAESSDPSIIHYTDGEGLPEGIKLQEDFPNLEQKIHLVREEDTDNILWASDNKSYDELLSKFIKTEEELKLSNFKLQLSEEEIVKLKIQIKTSEGQLDNALKELEMREDDLLEWQNQKADVETHVPDSWYKIEKLVEQLEVAQEQLKVSNDENTRLREELRSRPSGAHELQGQLEVAQENVATLKSELDSGRKHIRELEDRITWYKANETNHELKVQKLKAEMLDAKAQFSLEKDQMHSDILSFSEVNMLLDSRLKEWESRNNDLKSKLTQFEAEKLKLEELHATQQMVLQGEISCLKEELDQIRHDVEAVNKEYDMLMTERDGANAKIHKLEELHATQQMVLQGEISCLKGELDHRKHDVEAMNKEFDRHKQKYDMLMTERDGASAKIHKLEELHATQQMVLQGEIRCLKEELDQRRHGVEAMNKEFDWHKQKYDILMTERDGANAMIHQLMAEVSFRDNQIVNMERELFQLHAQQADLISGSETRLKLVNELKLKVKALEKELSRQNVVILDRAEEKREAIRQLCFSLEHYRSGYQELLRALTGHKRDAFIAS